MKKSSRIITCLIVLLLILSTMIRISGVSGSSEAYITPEFSKIISESDDDTVYHIFLTYDASILMPDIDFEEYRKQYSSNSEALWAYYTKAYNLIEPIVSQYMTLDKRIVKGHGGPFLSGKATADGCRSLMQLPEICSIDIIGETVPDLIYLSIHGDVDLNGTIDAEDARLALRAAAKLENLDQYSKLAADLNGDGNVTADEARKILRVAAELDSFD